MNCQLKNVVTGKMMNPGDFECDWQEFVLKRMKTINEKSLDEIDFLLDKINDQLLANNIRERFMEQIIKNGFINYNQGFANGIKGL